MPFSELGTLVLCADDYGLSAATSAAIRELALAGRISATSCITSTDCWPSEAEHLRSLFGSVEIGLHLNLTDDRSLGEIPGLTSVDRFPSLGRLCSALALRRVSSEAILQEFRRQYDRFVACVGRVPDFIDGHQHVHAFPVIRAATFTLFGETIATSGGWLRIPTMPWHDLLQHRQAVPRVIAVNLLGLGFRRHAQELGFPCNGTFRGIRDVTDPTPTTSVFPHYLKGLGTRPMIICHPALDGALRQDEFTYLMSDDFPALLERSGLRLGQLGSATPTT